METKNFITEEPKTSIAKNHFGWQGETYVKIKGFCYMITTSKGYSGFISSTARKVNDGGEGGGFRSVSFEMFGGETWDLLKEKANASEAKIRELHTQALNKFLAMESELPDKQETYKIVPGQVIIFIGGGNSESHNEVVYKVDEKTYYTVNKETLELGQGELYHLKDIRKQFGIGHYYEEGSMMNVDEVNELVMDAIQKRKRDEEERPAKEAAAKAEKAAAIAALKAEYPYLIERKEQGGGVFAAQNIRIELKRHFPNVKFRVRSEYSSVNIDWTDGPSCAQVKSITNKYEDHCTDHTGDFRDYDPSLFNKVFGGCNYVFENREISDETNRIITDWAKEHLGEGAEAYPEMLNREVNDMFQQNAIPATPWHITRAEDEHGYHIEALPVAPVPAVAAVPELAEGVEAAEAAPPAAPFKSISLGEAKVAYNAEKNGIEVSFPAKPSDETLNALKSLGFRWSKFSRVWWIKRTPELQQRLETLLSK